MTVSSRSRKRLPEGADVAVELLPVALELALELVHHRDPQLRFNDPAQATFFLRRFSQDSEAMRSLRAALQSAGAGAGAGGDDEVLRRRRGPQRRAEGNDFGWADRRRGAERGIERGDRSLAGLPETVTYHNLRHTCCAGLLRGYAILGVTRRWTLDEVCDFIGHSSRQVTEIYAHITGGGLADQAAQQSTNSGSRLGHALAVVGRHRRARGHGLGESEMRRALEPQRGALVLTLGISGLACLVAMNVLYLVDGHRMRGALAGWLARQPLVPGTATALPR